MSKVSLEKINESMDSFLKKADAVSLSKKDIESNLTQVATAIKYFERLLELMQAVGKESPRFKTYFDMAQSIASISDSNVEPRRLVEREAFLADVAGDANRLSYQESMDILKLMRSSKLEKFVEFMDAAASDDFNKFKELVIEVAKDAPKGADALKVLGVEANEDQGKPKDALFVEKLISLEDAVDRVEKSTDKVEQTVEEVADQKESDDSDSLIEYEVTKAEAESKEEANEELNRVLGAVKNKLRQDNVKKKEKEKSSPKGVVRQYFSDLKSDFGDFLKWSMVVGAGIAFITGLVNTLGNQILIAKKASEGAKKAIDKFYEEFNRDKDKKAEEYAASSDLPADELYSVTQNYVMSSIESAKETKDMMIGVGAENPDALSAYAGIPVEGLEGTEFQRFAQKVFKPFYSSETIEKAALYGALNRGSRVVDYRPGLYKTLIKGEVPSYKSVTPYMVNDDMTTGAKTTSATGLNIAEDNQKVAAMQSTRLILGEYPAGVGKSTLPESVIESNDVTEMYSYALENLLEMMTRNYKEHGVYEVPTDITEVSSYNRAIPDVVEGELLKAAGEKGLLDAKWYQSGDEKDRNQALSRLYQAQQTGNIEEVKRVIKETRYLGRDWSDDVELTSRAQSILNTTDATDSDEFKRYLHKRLEGDSVRSTTNMSVTYNTEIHESKDNSQLSNGI